MRYSVFAPAPQPHPAFGIPAAAWAFIAIAALAAAAVAWTVYCRLRRRTPEQIAMDADAWRLRRGQVDIGVTADGQLTETRKH